MVFKSLYFIYSHNLIRDVLYNACSSAALGPTREDRALLPGTEAKPADILLPGWSGGKDTALDITVVNPLQTQFINQSAAVAGHALRKAYERKMQRYGDSCKQGCIKLVSVVSRIPDKLLMVRQMTKKITTKKVVPDFLA